MAKAKKINAKKDIQAHILETLDKSLARVKEGMSEKKFISNIKKASKLIAKDFKVAAEEVQKKAKKKVNKIVEGSSSAK
ncbi:MAG: hypothetical protein ABIT58_08875 [Ferruginibacter sp.]